MAAERIGFIDGARTLAPSPRIADAIEALRKRWAVGRHRGRPGGVWACHQHRPNGVWCAPRAEALDVTSPSLRHTSDAALEALQKLWPQPWDGIRVAPMAGAGGDVGFQSVKR